MTTRLTEQAIATMSYPELRKACKKAKLHANGTKAILRQRLLSAGVVTVNQPSPKKTTCVKHLLCPITWELPFDPVMTVGFFYDRNAIWEHFSLVPGDNVKSPMTNLTIGRRLVPVPTIRSTIQSLIDDGLVGDNTLVEAWNQRIKDKQFVADALKRAEGGNTQAMAALGHCYCTGDHGVQIDLERALFWHRKAHSADCLVSTLWLGHVFLHGKGVPRDPTQGLAYLRMAADRGCLLATYAMGVTFGAGTFGIEKDAEKALFWLEKSLGTSSFEWDVMSEEDKLWIRNLIADWKAEIASK